MENSEEVLETLKTELPHDLAIPPMDLQAKENHNLKRHLFPKVHCSTMGNESNQKLPGQTPGEEDVSIGTMGGTSGKQKLAASSDDLRDTVSIPGVRMISWRRAWQTTPVFLPGESYGQRGLACYSP